MPAEALRTKSRVNILKKVKVGGAWKLCPAVLEANGKLKDGVRIGGRVEPHAEGATRSSGVRTASGGARLLPNAAMCARGRA